MTPMKVIEEIRLANLRALVEAAGGVARFAEKAGKQQAQISQLLNQSPDSKTGKPKAIGSSQARELEAAGGKEHGWMDHVHQDGDEEPAVMFSRRRSESDGPPMRSYPVIDRIAAGYGRDVADPFPPGGAYEYLPSAQDLSGHAFWLKIEGLSMMPKFQPGDHVLIEPAWVPQPSEFIAAKNQEGETTFKRYRSRGMSPSGIELFELVPLNEDFETIRSDQGGWQIVGTMAEHRIVSPRARRAANRAHGDRRTARISRSPLFDDGWPKPEDE